MDAKNENTITDEEMNGIEELRNRLGDEMKPEMLKDDNLFLRFLRARDGNVNKAELMLRNHLQTRKKYDADNILQFESPEVSKYFNVTFLGYDKGGSPIRYIHLGNMDVQGVVKSINLEDSMKWILKMYTSDEISMKKKSVELNKEITQWVGVLDFDNFTFFKATNKEVVVRGAQLLMAYEENYPERLKAAVVINTSVYFNLLFNGLKHLLSEKTLSKIHVYGRDGWKEKLLELMDAEDLPAFLGGNKKDADGNPMCPSFVNIFGPVPESYYFRSTERRLCNQMGIIKVEIPNRSKHRVNLDVDEPGSLLEWEFESENRDIGFGLYFQPHGDKVSKPQALVPKQRFDAHVSCETGVYHCDEVGKYTLIFDNSYSILRHKEIFYRALVMKPKNEKSAILS